MCVILLIVVALRLGKWEWVLSANCQSLPDLHTDGEIKPQKGLSYPAGRRQSRDSSVLKPKVLRPSMHTWIEQAR